MLELSSHIPEPALKLLMLLSKCPCDVCKKEIKRLEEKYSVDKKTEVNKAEDNNYHRERLNPEDHIGNTNDMIYDSPTPDNK